VPEVTLNGEKFALVEEYALMVVMDFAATAGTGADANEVQSLIALRSLLEHLIAPQEWERFHAHAIASKADGDALLATVREAIGAITERPTGLPSDSSDGHGSTAASSAAASSLRVIGRLEGQGRADLAEFVVQAQEESLTA